MGRPPALLLGAALIFAAGCFGLRDNLGGDGPFGLSDEAGAFVLDLGVPPPVLDGVFAFVNAAAAVVIFGLYLLIAACALEGRPWARVVGTAAALPAAAAACAAHSGAQLFAVLVAGLGLALLFTQQVSLWLADRRERSRTEADAVRAFLDLAAERYDESEENQDPDDADATGSSQAADPLPDPEPAGAAPATNGVAAAARRPADRTARNGAAAGPGKGRLWLRGRVSGRLARLLNLVRPSQGRPVPQSLQADSIESVGAGVPGGSGAGGAPASGSVRIDAARRRTVNGLLARRRRR